jgi:hypothetical protein
MKKLLSVFLALLATVCLLSVTVSAKAGYVLSEDLQTLTLGDRVYSRADLSAIDFYFDGEETVDIHLPANLQSQVKSAMVYSTDNQWIVSVELYYQDGSRLDICFAYEPVREELLKLCQDDELVCSIEFWWEDLPSVTAPISSFKGKPTTLEGDRLYDDEYYNILYYYKELGTYVYRGFLWHKDDRYYYVDHRENNTPQPLDYTFYYTNKELKAYEITDTELIGQIEECLDDPMDGSTEFGQALSAAFLCFVFLLIPLAIMIMSLIFVIRGKGYFRVTWGITAGLGAATLVLFMILALTVLLA